MEQFLLKALLIVMAPFIQSTYDYSGDHVYYCMNDAECVPGMVCYFESNAYIGVCMLEEDVPPGGGGGTIDPVDPSEPGGSDCTSNEGTCMSDADCIPGMFCICVNNKRECKVVDGR